MSAFTKLFGEKLLKGADTVTSEQALAGKTAVAIYFSAHWCPPCRGFTPMLAEWYTKDLNSKGLEVVFVSSDRDEEGFKDYFKDMPWLAVPYAERAMKDQLSKKFKCQGIPHLVILDGEGKVITLQGRAAVTGDPTGEDLPWKPKPISELLGDSFINKENKTVSRAEALKGKKLGLYFSAHWCPPCRNFTPKFAQVYKKLQEKNEAFEVVFCSSDRDEASFTEYFAEMPWLALPYADRKQKEALSNHFEVNGIPSLVILDEDLNVVNASAVGKIHGDVEGANFPWTPEAFNEIDEDADGIDEGASLVVLMEKADKSTQESQCAILKEIAEKYLAETKALKAKDEDAVDWAFFSASKQGQLADRVRGGTKQGEPMDGKTQVVLMDLPDNGGYYVFEGEFTKAAVEKFLSDYKAKSLPRMQFAGDE